MNEIPALCRSDKAPGRLSIQPRCRLRKLLTKESLLHAAHVMGPTLTALMFAGASSAVAHAQGTMDFSGAQTLMGTFKTVAALFRRADEATLSRLLVEAVILLAAARSNSNTVLRDAATAYKVDTAAIAAKVKQEFDAKEKAKKAPPSVGKGPKRAA